MKHALQIISTQLSTAIMAGVASVGFATAAAAAGAGADVGAGAQVGAPGTARAGANADAHMSPSGSANRNAQWQNGATRGADRAAERMGTHGDEPEQSTTAAKAKRSGTR